MSVEREVNVNFGDRHFRLVRTERVYEITDGEEKLIRKGGAYILNLTGHTAGSWETYQSNPNSFNTLDYQKRFREDNHYAFTIKESRPEESNHVQPPPEAERPDETEVIDSQIFPGTMVDVKWSENEEEWGLPAVSGKWQKPNGQWFVAIMKDGIVRNAPVENVSIHEIVTEESDVESEADHDTNDTAVAMPVSEPTIAETDLPPGSRPVYRHRGRAERALDRIRRRPAREYEPTGVYESTDGSYVRRVDEEWVAVAPGELAAVDETARAIGGVALIGAAALTIWELMEHRYLGHSPTHEARHNGLFPWHFGHGHNLGQGHFFDNDHKFDEVCHTGRSHHSGLGLVDLKGIGPDSIHAKTPNQFQHGVLGVLNRQGVHAHGVTAEKIKQMDIWMRGHRIASGMRSTAAGLKQNLTVFPGRGNEFVNAHASSAQGFQAGSGGNGHVWLDKWVRHAERIGIKFNRS